MYITYVFLWPHAKGDDCDIVMYITYTDSLTSTVFNHRSKKGKFLNEFSLSFLKDEYDIDTLFVHTKKTGMFVTVLCT